MEADFQVLLDYIRSMLYDSESKHLDVDMLEEPYCTIGREILRVQDRMKTMEAYNELLVQMTMKRTEWVMVVDARTREIQYCNKNSSLEKGLTSGVCRNCQNEDSDRDAIIQWDGDTQTMWDLESASGRFLRINSYSVEWHGRISYVHVIADITEEKKEESRLYDKAYFDSTTGIYNRRFFNEYLQQILSEKQAATMCYMDLDELKYINDHYGHLEGDEYIQRFVALIRSKFRNDDIFVRIGGDEFCLFLKGSLESLACRKLEEARESFMKENTKDYRMSFSYGVYQIEEGMDQQKQSEIIREADSRMYEYKKRFKLQRGICVDYDPASEQPV